MNSLFPVTNITPPIPDPVILAAHLFVIVYLLTIYYIF
jgi:hypothetical protein